MERPQYYAAAVPARLQRVRLVAAAFDAYGQDFNEAIGVWQRHRQLCECYGDTTVVGFVIDGPDGQVSSLTSGDVVALRGWVAKLILADPYPGVTPIYPVSVPLPEGVKHYPDMQLWFHRAAVDGSTLWLRGVINR